MSEIYIPIDYDSLSEEEKKELDKKIDEAQKEYEREENERKTKEHEEALADTRKAMELDFGLGYNKALQYVLERKITQEEFEEIVNQL